MNDLIYIVKLCGNAINALLAFEITAYIYTNRRDRLKGLTRIQDQPPTILKIAIGFFLFFLFSAISFIIYALELRWSYVISNSESIVIMLNNLKIIFVLYAFICLFLVHLSIFKGFNYRVPVLIVLVMFPIILFTIRGFINIAIVCAIILCALPILMLFEFVIITKNKLRRQFFSIFLGFLLITMGCVIQINLFDPFIPFGEYSISEIIVFMGLIFAGYGFISMRSLNEAFPAAFIEELYLSTSKGNTILRCQYKTQKNQNSEEDQAKMEEQFVASSLVGIDGLLREISSAEGLLKTLVHQNKILMVERATIVVGVFITRIDLRSLRSELIELIREVESKYLQEIQTQENLSDSTRSALSMRAQEWFKQELATMRPLTKILFNRIRDEIFNE